MRIASGVLIVGTAAAVLGCAPATERPTTDANARDLWTSGKAIAVATDETDDVRTAEEAVMAHPSAGRTALVTSAGHGIGRAVALRPADPCVEDDLVERVTAHAEPGHQRLQLYAVDHDRDEHPPLVGCQRAVDRAAYCRDELSGLGVCVRIQPKPGPAAVPLLTVERHVRVPAVATATARGRT